MEKLIRSGDEKLSWDGTSLNFEKDRSYGFSWPQRSYRCSFCKKDFKSAQALGGHMNVHRRDRARMRLSSPPSSSSSSWDSFIMNPNPSPSLNFSSASKFSPFDYKGNHSSSLSTDPLSVSLRYGKVPSVQRLKHGDDQILKQICEGNVDGHSGKKVKGNGMVEFTSRKDARFRKGNEFVRLDLNLGFIQDAKEDLDLELRLGCLD